MKHPLHNSNHTPFSLRSGAPVAALFLLWVAFMGTGCPAQEEGNNVGGGTTQSQCKTIADCSNPACSNQRMCQIDCTNPANCSNATCAATPTCAASTVDCSKPENCSNPKCAADPKCTAPDCSKLENCGLDACKNETACKAPDCTQESNCGHPSCKDAAICQADCSNPINCTKAACLNDEKCKNVACEKSAACPTGQICSAGTCVPNEFCAPGEEVPGSIEKIVIHEGLHGQVATTTVSRDIKELDKSEDKRYLQGCDAPASEATGFRTHRLVFELKKTTRLTWDFEVEKKGKLGTMHPFIGLFKSDTCTINVASKDQNKYCQAANPFLQYQDLILPPGKYHFIIQADRHPLKALYKYKLTFNAMTAENEPSCIEGTETCSNTTGTITECKRDFDAYKTGFVRHRDFPCPAGCVARTNETDDKWDSNLKTQCIGNNCSYPLSIDGSKVGETTYTYVALKDPAKPDSDTYIEGRQLEDRINLGKNPLCRFSGGGSSGPYQSEAGYTLEKIEEKESQKTKGYDLVVHVTNLPKNAKVIPVVTRLDKSGVPLNLSSYALAYQETCGNNGKCMKCTQTTGKDFCQGPSDIDGQPQAACYRSVNFGGDGTLTEPYQATKNNDSVFIIIDTGLGNSGNRDLKVTIKIEH